LRITASSSFPTFLAHLEVAALAELSDAELHALIDATYNVPQIAPGLLAWIEHACDWELTLLLELAVVQKRSEVTSVAPSGNEGRR
jgi:hypothetical protein